MLCTFLGRVPLFFYFSAFFRSSFVPNTPETAEQNLANPCALHAGDHGLRFGDE